MCGRFLLAEDLDTVMERFRVENSDVNFSAREEIYPSEAVPVILGGEARQIKLMKWGFLPAYSKNLLINARSETVDSKPTFRNSFMYRRCLVPASGFYEWEKSDGKSIKRKIFLGDGSLFSMAGIYSTFNDQKGRPFEAFTILTTSANERIRKIHHRMPVILDQEGERLWLHQGTDDILKIKSLLKPFDGEMTIA